jgi:WD40 repeat protein
MTHDPQRNSDSNLLAPETQYAAPAPGDRKAAEAATEEEWQAGETILDLYEVKGVLGEGGFGKVYRVRHTGWNIDLAVKTPRIDRLDESGKENFRREAETWVNLGLHPHIVSCYYVRDLGGIPRVFAEYVEGGSLADWISSRKLYEGGKDDALNRILDIAIQFAWGLHYAHEQGLVHQDVKPANLLMTAEGIAKVTDFGLAKARGVVGGEVGNAEGGSVLVASGGMTPAYASPEQAAGKRLARAADTWSWAVSVLEMFTGEITWMSGVGAADVLEEFAGPASDRDSIPGMPDTVRSLLLDCFKSNPSERPKTIADVANQLGQIYQEITGRSFARQLTKTGKALAGNSNNRAVSLLDLGKQKEAISLWDEALRIENHHPESTYNRGLVRWRAAEINDDALVKELEEVRQSRGNDWISDYLTALIHSERGDSDASMKALKNIQDGRNRPEVRASLTLAGKGASPLWELVTSDVVSVSIVADGTQALSASHKGLKLWDMATGCCLRTLEDSSASSSPGGLSVNEEFALGGSHKTLKLWEIATGRCVRTFEGHTSFVSSVSLTANGKYALSGSVDMTVKVWEVATGLCLRTLEGHADVVKSVSLSADGKYALSGSSDHKVKLWEIGTGRCLWTAKGHTSYVNSVGLSTDGKYALSGSYDHTVKLWEAATGQCLRTLNGHTHSVESVSLSADGKYALSGSDDYTVKFWELATGRCLRTFEGHEDAKEVKSVSLSADGGYALSASSHRLRMWRIQPKYLAPYTLSRIVTSEARSKLDLDFENKMVLAKEALASGNTVRAANCLRHARALKGYQQIPAAVELWAQLYVRLPRSGFNRAWESRTLKGHTDSVYSVDLSADGKYALSGSADQTVKLWEVATGLCLRTFEGHTKWVNSVSLSADGKYALSGSADQPVKLWEATTGRCLRTFNGHTDYVESVGLSTDGKYTLSGSSDNTLKLWEVATGRCLRTFEGHKKMVTAVCLGADGQYVLSASGDETLKLWEVATGRCFRTFQEGHFTDSWVNSVSLSADGRYALSAGRFLKLWEVATSRCLQTFGGQGGFPNPRTSDVRSAILSGDGKYVLSAHYNQLKMWEPITKQCLWTFQGHATAITSSALSADGRYAVSGGVDHSLKLWVLDWELEEREPAEWDEGARDYLRIFLNQQTPYAGALRDSGELIEEITKALTRKGKPLWSESDFQRLLCTLGYAGYGWLRSEGVRRELEKMMEERSRTSSPSGLTHDPDHTSSNLAKLSLGDRLLRLLKRK